MDWKPWRCPAGQDHGLETRTLSCRKESWTGNQDAFPEERIVVVKIYPLFARCISMFGSNQGFRRQNSGQAANIFSLLTHCER